MSRREEEEEEGGGDDGAVVGAIVEWWSWRPNATVAVELLVFVGGRDSGYGFWMMGFGEM